MINKISIYTKFGWISAFENNNKITKIKFGKVTNSIKSKVLKKSQYANFGRLQIQPEEWLTQKS